MTFPSSDNPSSGEKNSVCPPRSEARAPLPADRGLRKRAFEALTYHCRHHIGRSAVSDGEICGVTAVAKHSHVVAQRIELFHAVRNVEQRNAVVRELAQYLEQALHVWLRQGRSRFVEQDQPRTLA